MLLSGLFRKNPENRGVAGCRTALAVRDLIDKFISNNIRRSLDGQFALLKECGTPPSGAFGELWG